MSDLQLLVVGDSHAHFFTGGDFDPSPQLIAGIHKVQINAASAWGLLNSDSETQARQIVFQTIDQAIAAGFRGWLMLSFGEVDLRVHVFQHALTLGIHEAVRRVVERYVAFIQEVRLKYRKLAIWGPIASKGIPNHYGGEQSSVGSTVERNFATMLFTKLLRHKLDGQNIPVLSVLDHLIREDGSSRSELTIDGIHLSQMMMPVVLPMLKFELGIDLEVDRNQVPFIEIPVREFLSAETRDMEGKRWLVLTMYYGAFLPSIAFGAHGALQGQAAHVLLSEDGKGFERFSFPADTGPNQQINTRRFPLNHVGRVIALALDNAEVDAQQVDLRIRTSRLTPGPWGNGCSRAMMHSMTDELLSQHHGGKHMPAISGTILPERRDRIY